MLPSLGTRLGPPTRPAAPSTATARHVYREDLRMGLAPGTRRGHYDVTALLGGPVCPALRGALSVLVAMGLLVPDRRGRWSWS